MKPLTCEAGHRMHFGQRYCPECGKPMSRTPVPESDDPKPSWNRPGIGTKLGAVLVAVIAVVATVVAVTQIVQEDDASGASGASSTKGGPDPGDTRLPAEVVMRLNLVASGNGSTTSDSAEPACLIIARTLNATIDRDAVPVGDAEITEVLGPDSTFTQVLYGALNLYPQDAADTVALARDTCPEFAQWYVNEHRGRPE